MTALFKAFSIGIAALAVAAMVDASTAANAADASSQAAPVEHRVGKPTDAGARRHDARVAPVEDGYYDDRPVAYRPYPYRLPAPFVFGIGFDPR